MANLTIVVATDAAGGIGINNTLPWKLPEDLAHFKRVTTGHPIIMGRKTFDSIGRPLPNRRNIVVTRDLLWQRDGALAVASVEAALALVGEERASIIGGAQIYAASMHLVDELIVTEIAHTYNCDAFFPPIDQAAWQEVTRESHHSLTLGVDYAFVTWRRKA